VTSANPIVAAGAAMAMGTLAVACARSESGSVHVTPISLAAAAAPPFAPSTVSRVHADEPVRVPVAPQDAPAGRPDATVDLGSREGVDLLRGQWRYSDVRIVEVSARGPGPDLKPTGKPIRTYDYEPKAGALHFDDSHWDAIPATSLETRRSTGKVCFAWYRINLTIPQHVGIFDPSGSTVAFEIVIDDYAEVWVDGELPRRLGQAGGPVVKGFNAPNRVIVGRDVKPGQQIQLAVFAMNGPISASPDNFIWIKSATLDFYKTAPVRDVRESLGVVDRRDPLSDGYLNQLEQVIDRIQPAWVSDHLCWGAHGGKYAHDLLPLPYTRETVEHVVSRVDAVQNRLRCRILLENVSAYLAFSQSDLDECDVLNEVADRTGCGLLVDVNNVYVCSRNLGIDASAYVDAIEPRHVGQIHLAGHSLQGDLTIDTHIGPVPDPVWDLYRRALRRFGHVPTLIEWDDEVPAYDELVAESYRARDIEREVLNEVIRAA
jgi:uncharacterized protein (UPF0276 family)